MARTVLRIDGMSCDHCVSSLTKALESLSGVSRATVSLAEKRATVEHGEGATAAELIAAVEDEGYTASAE